MTEGPPFGPGGSPSDAAALTRAAPITSGRAQKQIPVGIELALKLRLGLALRRLDL